METKLTIGAMAKMNGVSEKTLRLYHKQGLLEPAYVDEHNGYRYYSLFQSAQLDMIQQMKAVGFSLEEIRSILKRQDVGYLEELLKRHRERLDQEIRQLILARQMAGNLEKSCELVRDKPVCDTVFVERLPRRPYLRLPIDGYGPAGGDFPLERALYNWETSLRQVKKELIGLGLPLSMFRNVGCVVRREDLQAGRVFFSEAFLWVREGFEHPGCRLGEAPEGDYLCVYCDGVETDTAEYKEEKYLSRLLSYIRGRGYRITGDYMGEVLADTPAFCYDGRDMMLKLQIPIAKEDAQVERQNGGFYLCGEMS